MARPPSVKSAPPRKSAPEVAASPALGLNWMVTLAHAALLGLVLVAMTPLTNNLDDIKKTLFLVIGPWLGVAALFAMARGAAPLPPKWVAWGLASYLVVVVVSTLNGRFHWAGRQFTTFTMAAYGWFLAGVVSGSTWGTWRAFHRVVVGFVLAITVFGFMQYDILGNGRTATMWLYEVIYGPIRAGEQGFLQALLYTFNAGAQRSLMSTALNRDFYAAFCLLYMPLCATLALLSRGWIARAMGIAGSLFALTSIFLCKSKGEYLFGAAEIVIYAILFAAAVRQLEVRLSYVGAWVLGAAMLLGVFLAINLPTIMGQLKTVNFSVSSREIIFRGGWNIFLNFPILGSGPGSFFIYFPQYRSPDYFLHEISNVTELSHNYLLDILCETGLVGSAAFALFGLSLAGQAFRWVFRAEDRRLRLSLIACLCGLFGLYGSNMTSTSARWPIGAVGLWSIMGVIAGMVRQAEGWSPKEGWQEWTGLADAGARGDRAGNSDSQQTRQIIALVAALVATAGIVLGGMEGMRYWRGSVAYNEGLVNFNRVTELHMADLSNNNLPADRRKALAATLEAGTESFKKALAIYPELLSAYYKLGSAQNFLANLQPQNQEQLLRDSKRVYEKLMEYAPDYAEIHFNMGVIHLRLGLLAKSKLAKLPPQAAEQRKALEEEAKVCETERRRHFEIMRRMSNKSDVFKQLASTYLTNGLTDLAQEIFREGMKMYPDEEMFAKGLYEASNRLGDSRGKLDALTELVKRNPAIRPIVDEALSVASDPKFDADFDRLIGEALERNPVDPSLYERLARVEDRRRDAAKTKEAALNYLKLTRRKEVQAIPEFKAGPKSDMLKLGARVAEASGDLATAKIFQQEIAARPGPDQAAAQVWLQGR